MCLTVLSALMLLCMVSAVVYVHEVGFNDTLRSKLSAELAKRGVRAEFTSLKFKLNQGLVAEDVVLYEDDARTKKIADIKHLIIDVDKTKLVRGILQIDTLELQDGNLSIPINPKDPDSLRYTITNINGSMLMPDKGIYESRQGISANFEGVEIDLRGRVWSSEIGKKKKLSEEELKQRAETYQKFVETLRSIKYRSEKKTRVKLFAEGDLSDPAQFYAEYSVEAEKVSYRDQDLLKLELNGSYTQKLFTVHKLLIEDNKGQLTAEADFDLVSLECRVDLESELNLQSVAKKLFNYDLAPEITFKGERSISMNGSILLPSAAHDREKLILDLQGAAQSETFAYLENSFDYMQFDFSWRGESLFVDELTVLHPNGEITGRLLMSPNKVQFKATSSLPASVYLPFLKGRGIDKTIAQTKFSDDSRVRINAEGVVNRDDITDWTAKGHIDVEDITYRGTKLAEARGDFSLQHNTSDYHNLEAKFDFSDFEKQKLLKTPSDGRIKVDHVNIWKEKETGVNYIRVTNISGKVWPSPVVRLFEQRAADAIFKMPLQSMVTCNKADFHFKVIKPGWKTTGTVDLADFSFNDIQLDKYAAKMEFERGVTTLSNLTADFNYDNYHLEKKYPSKADGVVKSDEVKINFNEETGDQDITIKNVRGTVWPSAAAQLFAPKTAKAIESFGLETPVNCNSADIRIINNLRKQDAYETTVSLDTGAFTMRGVKMKSAKAKMQFLPGRNIHQEITAVFDYSNYAKHKSYPSSNKELGIAKADKVTVEFTKDSKDQTITVENLTGVVWPAPLTRLFAPDTANILDDLDFQSPLESKKTKILITKKDDKWSTHLNVNFGRLRYNSVPLHSFSGNLQFIDGKSIYSGLAANFDYTAYAMRKAHGGPTSKLLKIKEVIHDQKSNIVKISRIADSFYPAPLVRLFSKDVADHLEEYRFYRPPYISVSGQVDANPNGNKTALSGSFKTSSTTRYEFLDKNLYLTGLKAGLSITSNTVKLTDLQAYTFGAKLPIKGHITVSNLKQKNPNYSGLLQWKDMQLSSIGKTYEFGSKASGTLQGWIQFRGNTGDVGTMNGHGYLQLSNGNLFSVPILGPLSPLMRASLGKLAGDKRVGYERVKDARAKLNIINGRTWVHELSADSANFGIAGQGLIDLKQETINLQIGVNKLGGGLLQLLKAPLAVLRETPLTRGLLHFRGTGPIKKPKWSPDIGAKIKMPPLPKALVSPPRNRGNRNQ